MVEDIPGFVKSHLTKIIFEKNPMQTPLLKKKKINKGKNVFFEKELFYRDIVFIPGEENKLQY